MKLQTGLERGEKFMASFMANLELSGLCGEDLRGRGWEKDHRGERDTSKDHRGQDA